MEICWDRYRLRTEVKLRSLWENLTFGVPLELLGLSCGPGGLEEVVVVVERSPQTRERKESTLRDKLKVGKLKLLTNRRTFQARVPRVHLTCDRWSQVITPWSLHELFEVYKNR